MNFSGGAWSSEFWLTAIANEQRVHDDDHHDRNRDQEPGRSTFQHAFTPL